MSDTDLPLPPKPRPTPGRATSDRHAIVDARAGGELGRIRNTRARMALIRERARDGFRERRDAIERERRGPGFSWRGWWYPRALVLGIAWTVVAVLGVALVAGLLRLFGGAA